MFAQTVCPDPTAIAVELRRYAELQALIVYRWGGTATWKKPAPSVLASKDHGKADASIRTDAATSGDPELTSVMTPWNCTSGPDAIERPGETSMKRKAASRTRLTDTGARAAGWAMRTPADRNTADTRRRIPFVRTPFTFAKRRSFVTTRPPMRRAVAAITQSAMGRLRCMHFKSPASRAKSEVEWNHPTARLSLALGWTPTLQST